MLHHRNLTSQLADALAETPVVLLDGPRESGRSTLIRELLPPAVRPSRYVSLGDAATLAAARTAPAEFLRDLTGRVAIDEVQRAPELLPAARAEADRDPAPGRFLLSASVDAGTLGLPETSAERMRRLTLWPFSQGERERLRERFVDLLFADGPLPGPAGPAMDVNELRRRVTAGGHPGAMQRERPVRRRAWFASLLTTVLERDVRDLSRADRLPDLLRLLEAVAGRSASPLNFAALAREAAIPQTTLKRLLALLEATFLVRTLPAWAGDAGRRLARSPALVVADAGLAAHLAGDDGEADAASSVAGTLPNRLLKTFVVSELRKQVAWSDLRPRIYTARDYAGWEVDVVLEDAAGRIAAIQVRASRTVGPAELRHLETLRDAAGERFRRGVVLHAGSEPRAVGPRLHAMPVDALWRLGAEPHPA